MAAPLYDAISVRHSRNIGDKVTAAATDGVVWSSAQRDTHLNAAIRRWMLLKWQQQDFLALQNYVNGEAQALAANIKALSGWTGGVSFILSAINTTQSPNVIVKPLPEKLRVAVASGANSYLNATAANEWWVINAGSIYVYGAGATDNINLQYVKGHTDMVNAATNDWLVPSLEANAILDLALVEAMGEKATQENVARIQAKQSAIQQDFSVKSDIR